MSNKLVVCCDGTWNYPERPTNVFRTYAAVREAIGWPSEAVDRATRSRTCRGRTSDGTPVTLFYDHGVGTSHLDRWTGGALGKGLSDNVRDAYHFLCSHYRVGDEIYVFGFSRGGYTARSLCGFIEATGGLMLGATRDQVDCAYRERYIIEDRLVALPAGVETSAALQLVRDRIGVFLGIGGLPNPEPDVRIRFLGVWDTVGALGVPLPKAMSLNEAVVGFHKVDLGGRIDRAVHALAVDERRGPYLPTLWSLPPASEFNDPDRCLQVWFPGVHSDVGGGYQGERGIGDLTLDFMLRRAAESGLPLDFRGRPPVRLARPPVIHSNLSKILTTIDGFVEDDAVVDRPIGQIQRRRFFAPMVPDAVAGRELLHACLMECLNSAYSTVREDEDGNIVERQKGERYRPPNLDPLPDLPVFTE